MENKELFDIVNAKSDAFENYECGDIPFVTNGFENNGVLGFVKSKEKDRVFRKDCICISAFCEATVQKAPFIARGNGGSGLKILIPNDKISMDDLLLVASYINKAHQWKYNYGRMITKERLRKISEFINISKLRNSVTTKINIESLLPKPSQKIKITHNSKWKEFTLTQLFNEISEGDYHVSSILTNGEIPFISCNSENNGLAGYFEIPVSQTYEKCMTITSDGEYAFTPFYHPYKFNAQDNVLICKPNKETTLPIIFFVMFQLRRMQWRFSYGRKCYSNKIDKIKFKLPITDDSSIDEKYIEHLVTNCYGWNLVQKYFN